MGTRLYVGNLPFNTDENAIKELFSADGRQVTEVMVGDGALRAWIDFDANRTGARANVRVEGWRLPWLDILQHFELIGPPQVVW